MTTKLTLYNGAVRVLGETSLASLTEEREPRRVLDEIYDDGVVYCLEQGLWNFAMRAVEIDAEAAIDPGFGYTSAFLVPSDWVRTDAVSLSSSLRPPLIDYVQERGYWYANGDPLYVRYISKDADYGLDLSLWPITFVRYVETHLAAEMAERIVESATKIESIRKLEARRKSDASGKDVMNEGPRFPPRGSWVTSRGGGFAGQRSSGR